MEAWFEARYRQAAAE